MTKDRYIYEALTLRSFMLMLENMDDPLTLIKLSVGIVQCSMRFSLDLDSSFIKLVIAFVSQFRDR